MEFLSYLGVAGIYLLGGAITLVVLKFVDPSMPLDDTSPGARTIFTVVVLAWPAIALWLLFYVPCLGAISLANYLVKFFWGKNK